MAFAKKHWLYAGFLVVLICAASGIFLFIQARQPAEPVTVYALPERSSQPTPINEDTAQNTVKTLGLSPKKTDPADSAKPPNPPSATSDPIAADLLQKQVEMQTWAPDLLNQFPDVPAVTALVDSYRELLDRVIARNTELQEKAYPKKERIKLLTLFAQKIILDIEERRHSGALHMQLMRDDPKLKVEIDRYTHKYDFFPLPLYLIREGVQPRADQHD